MTATYALGFLLTGVLPVTVLFCWAAALTGDTRPLAPALAGMAGALALLAAGLLFVSTGIVINKGEQIAAVTLLAVPPLIFAGLYVRSRVKRKAVKSIPAKGRWILALGPALVGAVVGWEIVLALVIVALGAVSLFCAVSGRVPAPLPLGKAAVICLSGLPLLVLLDGLRLPRDLVFVLALASLVAGLLIAYKPLAPGTRLSSWKAPKDLRWALGGAGMLVAAVFAMPSATFGGCVLPVLVAVCAFCAVSGNTRAVMPGVIGLATAVGCGIWASGIRGLDAGAAWFVLLVVLGLPLAVFAGWYVTVVLCGWETRALPMPGRIAAGVAALAMACIFAALLRY